jgi:hypothetical protein
MASFVDAIGKKMGKGLGDVSIAGLALDSYFVVDMYKQSRNEGHNMAASAARAGGEQFIMSAMGMPAYIGMQVAMAAPGLAVNGYESLAQQARSMQQLSANKPFQTAQFTDSQAAYTMRQAGMKLAQASKYNGQQAMMGNEASYLHY